MKSYKVIKKCLLLIAVLLLLTITTYATEQPTIMVDDVVSSPGKTVVVPVKISENPGIIMASFTIEYNQDVLTLISVDDTEEFRHSEARNKNYQSPYIVVWTNDSFEKDVTDDGVLVNLLFYVSEEALDGTYDIKLQSLKDGMLNSQGVIVDFSLIDGDISVKSEIHSHKWSSWEKYNNKFHKHICECGEIEYEEHKWNSGIVTIPATEDEKGIKTHTCTKCSATELWYYSLTSDSDNKPTVPINPPTTSRPSASYTCSYTDISNHWAKDIIQYIDKLGLIDGATATTFAPDKPMTREVFVTAMARLAGVKSDYVDWAIDIGLLKGYGNGEYGLKDTITREQMAVFFLRFLELTDVDYEDCKIVARYNFADHKQIADWAEAAVYEMQALDLIHGKGNGIFDPKGLTTRAEGATVLYNMCKTVLKK